MFELTVSAIASVSLLTLSLYLFLKRKTAADVALSAVIFLFALIEIADQLSLNLQNNPLFFKRLALFLESMLPAFLMLFTLSHSRWRSVKSISFSWWALTAAALFFPVSALVFPANDFFYSPDLQTEKLLFLGTVGYWFYMGVMIYCVIALIHLEAAFSVTSTSDRWRIKLEVIGVGSILAVMIFYFSQGLLYRSINMNLIPVRSGAFIVAAILVGYSRIFRGNGVRITVSRYVLYRSLSLILVGLYLLFLGLIGEGMRYLGASFSRDIAIFIAFTAGIVMLIILFSERLRRRAKVLINKHFYANKYDYRTEWLNFTTRLTSCRNIADVRDVILSTFRETFGLNGASLYILDDNKKRYAQVANQSMHGEMMDLNASEALISYFRDRDRVFNPFDGEYMPDADEALFIERTGARLLVPLMNNGRIEGIVVFGEQLAEENFIYEDFDLMKTIARHATLALLNFRLSEELAETREVAAVAKISSFVIHDLKNHTTTLSLLLDNARDYLDDPEFQEDMIKSIRNTLTKMKDLIQRLKTVPEKQELNPVHTDINFLAEKTVCEVMKIKPDIKIEYDGTSAVSVVDAVEIRKVILNILLNAVEAVGEDGVISVETGSNGDMTYVRVEDNGCGMTDDFINNHLFKPFRTTKEKGLGIGLYQCRQIVDAHDGRIEVNSAAGKGSVFTVHLPMIKEAEFATG
ncbi:Sensory transduction histidine kinases [hydrothermal vent metagenome]|uniref:Sensory transduction histidine kinases n=1 Tax=hydrothermal vent metagenome TaxID=652676 RepID=A0A3B1CQS4_9ZZZZ